MIAEEIRNSKNKFSKKCRKGLYGILPKMGRSLPYFKSSTIARGGNDITKIGINRKNQ
jgi:hypothetical protein